MKAFPLSFWSASDGHICLSANANINFFIERAAFANWIIKNLRWKSVGSDDNINFYSCFRWKMSAWLFYALHYRSEKLLPWVGRVCFFFIVIFRAFFIRSTYNTAVIKLSATTYRKIHFCDERKQKQWAFSICFLQLFRLSVRFVFAGRLCYIRVGSVLIRWSWPISCALSFSVIVLARPTFARARPCEHWLEALDGRALQP